MQKFFWRQLTLQAPGKFYRCKAWHQGWRRISSAELWAIFGSLCRHYPPVQPALSRSPWPHCVYGCHSRLIHSTHCYCPRGTPTLHSQYHTSCRPAVYLKRTNPQNSVIFSIQCAHVVVGDTFTSREHRTIAWTENKVIERVAVDRSGQFRVRFRNCFSISWRVFYRLWPQLHPKTTDILPNSVYDWNYAYLFC